MNAPERVFPARVSPDQVRRILDRAGGGDRRLCFVVDREPGGQPSRLGICDEHAPPESPVDYFATFQFADGWKAARFDPWQSAAVALLELAPDLARGYLRACAERDALRRELAELRGDAGPALNASEVQAARALARADGVLP